MARWALERVMLKEVFGVIPEEAKLGEDEAKPLKKVCKALD